MNEYAVLNPAGEVEAIILTRKGLSEVRGLWRSPYVVKPIEDVPDDVLRRYEFWEKRP